MIQGDKTRRYLLMVVVIIEISNGNIIDEYFTFVGIVEVFQQADACRFTT